MNWLTVFIPEIMLTFAGIGGLLLSIIINKQNFILNFTKITILLAFISLIFAPHNLLIDFFTTNSLINLFKSLVLLCGIIILILYKQAYLENEFHDSEFPILMSFALLGMMVIISANNLLALFIGMEIQNLSIYIITALRRDSKINNEVILKYFITGAVVSGLMLFGISLIYAFTGSIDYQIILQHFNKVATFPENVVGVVGISLLILGCAFKLSLAPLHSWAPDVYEGSPTIVTTLIASAPKIAVCGALVHLYLHNSFFNLNMPIRHIFTFLAIISMIWGTIGALIQENIKRLIAYGAIANMGFMMIGFAVNNDDSIKSLLFYLVMYVLMTIGVFACLININYRGYRIRYLKDLHNLNKHYPGTTFAFVFILFSLAGIPPLPGFFAKLYLLKTAVANQHYSLSIVAVLTSIIAAAYYLIVIKSAIFDMQQQYTNFEYKRSNFIIRIILTGLIITLITLCIKTDTLFSYFDNILPY